MKLASSYAIASCIKESELSTEYIIPSPFDKSVAEVIANKLVEICLAISENSKKSFEK
jgi:malate dehydrogenase (oxaloacetate-decarboxylating)